MHVMFCIYPGLLLIVICMLLQESTITNKHLIHLYGDTTQTLQKSEIFFVPTVECHCVKCGVCIKVHIFSILTISCPSPTATVPHSDITNSLAAIFLLAHTSTMDSEEADILSLALTALKHIYMFGLHTKGGKKKRTAILWKDHSTKPQTWTFCTCINVCVEGEDGF